MDSTSPRERLRMFCQLDLARGAEILTGDTLYSIQRRIGAELSRPRAMVAVPSCNASGKTAVAARLALAFYEAFTPGTPCVICKGPCQGSKVITTSSKEEHLRDNLWGEIATAYARAEDRGFKIPGRFLPGDLRIYESEANHMMRGQTASRPEGLQGYHAAHLLVVGDEATSVTDEAQLAITRLLSSGDARLLLIYNPTTPDTYASRMSRSAGVTCLRITAWDTPNFTGEELPPGANLISQDFLDMLEMTGRGPGTFEWCTSVEAKDWDLGEDLLISPEWYQRVRRPRPLLGRGVRQIGVDLASYGNDECVIAVRDGDQLIAVEGYPSMRMDTFFETRVTEMVQRWQPHYVVYDADGIGAGVIAHAERLKNFTLPGAQIIGFRGNKASGGRFRNQRSAWYWHLRQLFENAAIGIGVNDPTLEEQITNMRYSIPTGDIRVETKQEMRRRGIRSPDRADAVMYAFSMSGDLAVPVAPKKRSFVEDAMGVTDDSEEAMWERLTRRRSLREANPVLGVPDDW